MATSYEEKQPSLLKDIATAPISPSAYAMMYGMSPGFFKPGLFGGEAKGVMLPWIGKSLEQGGWKAVGSGIKNTFTGAYSGFGKAKGIGGKFRNATTGTLRLGGKFAKGGLTMGFTEGAGGGYVGGNWLAMGKEVKEFQSEIKSRTLSFLKKKGHKSDDIFRIADEVAGEALENISKGKTIGRRRFGITRGRIRYSKIKNYKKIKDLVKTQGVGKLATASAGRGLARAALTGGKIVGTIGMIQFGYDFLTAIGRPIGSAAMTAIDNTMTEYQNRFMPETGGELNLAYITQGAATERQRAIQSISKAQINGRRAIGNEAAYAHS